MQQVLPGLRLCGVPPHSHVTKTSPLWMLYPKTLAHDRKTAGANHKTNHLLANGKLPKKNGNTPGNVYIAKPWARDELPTYVNPDDCIHNSNHPFQLKMNGGPQASPSLILGNAKTYFQEGHYKRGLEGQAAASFQQTNTMTNIGADAWMPPSPPGSEPRAMPPSPPPTSEEEQNQTEHPPRWFTKTKQRENDSNTRRHKRRTHTSVREQPRHSMRRESRRRSSRSDKPKRKRTKPRHSRRTRRRHRRRSTTDDSYDSDTSGDSYSSSE